MNDFKEILTDDSFSLIDGEKTAAKVEFEKTDTYINITKTMVDPSYQGKGLAKILMTKCQQIATREKLAIKATCSYAIEFFNL